MISTLAESEIEGARLTDEDIFAFLLLILPAGVETTYRAVNALLDRLPADLRLDPTAPTPSIAGVAFRSPSALPVRFTPAA